MDEKGKVSGVAERVWKAVDALATSASPIQARLENAGITLIPLEASEFPDEETRQKFTEIKQSLTAREAKAGEGAIAATTSQLTDAEAEEIAQAIFRLDTICRPLPV